MARPRATAIAPYLKGIAAGTAATLAVSILIVLKRSLAIPGAALIAVFAAVAVPIAPHVAAPPAARRASPPPPPPPPPPR